MNTRTNEHTSARQTDLESTQEFRARLRPWLAANMPRADLSVGATGWRTGTDEEELADVAQHRELQRRLFDGGFAGITLPTEYGGQGLTEAHMGVFNQEIAGYEYPSRFQIPTFCPCMAVLLDFGTEEQKRAHIPAMLRGDEIWQQFLSEPSGGSDVASARTTAVRDGDEWVINGSKIWTSGAWWSDWGLCLTRTNWDVPKHRGLTVFIFPIHQDAIELNRIEMLNGNNEFCQEYITDLRVPDSDRIGEVDQGWTVGTRWMTHERRIHSSPLVIHPEHSLTTDQDDVEGRSVHPALAVARRSSGSRDLADGVRELIGEARAIELAERHASARINEALMLGVRNEQSAAMSRLMSGVTQTRTRSILFEIAGSSGAAWSADDADLGTTGVDFLIRQMSQIAGGTTEMARNVISERVLGMPRDASVDKDVPFREVPDGAR